MSTAEKTEPDEGGESDAPDDADDAGADADAGGAAGLEPPDEPPEWLSLEPGEEVRWAGEPAIQSLVPAFAWGLVLLPLLGLGLLVWAAAIVQVRNTDFVVTNTTLYHRSGVLSTNIESVGLDRIQNTEYSQSLSGNLLGYGTIEISTAGSSGSDLSFTSVENAREIRDLVSSLGGAGGGRPAATGDDDAAPAGGAGEELVRELQSELAAVNDSMRTVERLLREREGAGPATTDADPGSTPSSAPGASDTPTPSADAGEDADRPTGTDADGDGEDAGEGADESGPSGSAVEFVKDDADDEPQS